MSVANKQGLVMSLFGVTGIRTITGHINIRFEYLQRPKKGL